MSSKGYATPLRLEVGVNPLLQRLYLGINVSAVIALLSLPLPLLINLSAAALLLFVATRVWRRRAELGGSPVQLVWDGEQQWWWRQEGREYAAELRGDSYLATRWVVLNFVFADSRLRRAAVLTPAAIGDEAFRRMRVRFQITPKDSSPA